MRRAFNQNRKRRLPCENGIIQEGEQRHPISQKSLSKYKIVFPYLMCTGCLRDCLGSSSVAQRERVTWSPGPVAGYGTTRVWRHSTGRHDATAPGGSNAPMISRSRRTSSGMENPMTGCPPNEHSVTNNTPWLSGVEGMLTAVLPETIPFRYRSQCR